MIRSAVLAALYVLLLAGCQSHGAAGSLAAATASVDVTAVGQIQTTAHNGKLLAVMQPHVKADIASVVLTLATQAEPTRTVAALTVPAASLESAVSFTKLKHLTAYQVTAQAFDSTGAPIDNLAIAPATCTTLFASTTDFSVAIGVIKLRLKDKDYNGQTNATSIGVVDGQIVDAPTTTAIIIAP